MSYYFTPTNVQYYANSAFAITAGYVINEPFDLIKVRLQQMPYRKDGVKPLYKGTMDCFEVTVKNEGYLALYKGITPTFISFVITPWLCEYGTAFGQRILQVYYGKTMYGCSTFKQGIFMVSMAGIFTSVIIAPTERVKCMLQIETSSEKFNTTINIVFTAPWIMLKKLYREGGIPNIYHGFTVTVLQEVLVSGIFYSVSTYISQKAEPYSKSRFAMSFIFFVVTHGIATSIIVPIDVIKTRIQTAPKEKYPTGIQSVAKEIAKYEGITGFFQGFVPQTTSLFLSFTAYYSHMMLWRILK